MIAGFLLAMEVALQFDIDIFVAENGHQAFYYLAAFLYAAVAKRDCQWTIFVASKADQTGGVFLKFVFKNRAFIFLGAQLHSGEQAAEILMSRASCDEQGKP